MRIELTLSAWKAEVLPLNYIRIMVLLKTQSVLQEDLIQGFYLAFDKSPVNKMERKTRFELATLALARRCSTPEPLPHIK